MNNIKTLFIAISLLLAHQITFASIDDIDEWWRDREIILQQNREDYAQRVYGRSAKSFTEKSGDPNWSLNNPSNPNSGNTKTVTKTVVVEDVPSKSKAGSAGLKRLKALARGGVAGAGIQALVEGVGWIMKDGTYVKYKQEDEFPTTCANQYVLKGEKTINQALSELKTKIEYKEPNSFSKEFIAIKTVTCNYRDKIVNVKYDWKMCSKDCAPSPDYTYSNPTRTSIEPFTIDRFLTETPEPETIEITAEDIGGLLLGDYDDPVDEQYDVKDNIYKPPLADLYQHDATGVGNELAKEMDQKLQNAQPTPDGNPAPIGDSRYANPPQQDADTNDRSWESDADQVDGESNPVIDPETGEPTGSQSIKLQFPVFCEWAYTVCDWYDKWKITDKWLKEEPQLQNEQLEIQEENILDYQHQNHVSFGQSCPFSPNATVIDFGISSFSFDTDLSFICTWGAQARSYVITLGHLGALIFLLLGIRNGNV